MPDSSADESSLGVTADEATGDLQHGDLRLRGSVLLWYQRFRLRSEELHLHRTPLGVAVQGPGALAFCACPDPWVSIVFQRAILAPPTDLFLKGLELKLGRQTVFALPWMWLRSPERWGVLPPQLAYRATDGIFLGSGVHVPLGDNRWLDVSAGGYSAGGAEVLLNMDSGGATTHVRWDHVGSDLLAIDLHGSDADSRSSFLTWDVDVIRGARARSATVSLEQASRVYDYARLDRTVAESWGDASVGLSYVQPRGQQANDAFAAGPRASFGTSGSWGSPSAEWMGDMGWATLSDGAGATAHVLHATIASGGHLRPGPLVLEADVRGRGAFVSRTTSVLGAGWATGKLRAALPLVREFAGGELRHILEPAVFASGLVLPQWPTLNTETASSLLRLMAPPVRDARLAAVSGGSFRTAFGSPWARWGGEAEATVGLLHADAPTRWLRAQAAFDAPLVGVNAEVDAIGARADTWTRARGWVMLGEGRLGQRGGVGARLHVARLAGAEPIEARALSFARVGGGAVGWLNRDGTTAGANAVFPLGTSLRGEIGADVDVSASVLLASGGGIHYTHPCRCLALSVWAGERLGRGATAEDPGRRGVDVGVSVDLAPPM